MSLRLLLLVFAILLVSPARAAQNIVDTMHNLSVSGPGSMRSLSVDRVCAFCHTPHNPTPLAPRWNRVMSGATYIEYGSSTMDARPGQPTGQSRLCLSCHDGTVALGRFFKAPRGPVNDLKSSLLTGTGNLGTDLRDDHPISFPYDSALQAADPKLVHPTAIDLPLENGEMQCTSCHDVHEKDLAPFLRKSTLNSELCTTCHQLTGTSWSWGTSSHATSTARPTGASPWPERKPQWQAFTNVAEGGCLNCHASHNAVTPVRLIKAAEENTCYLCHDGSVAATNIQIEALKPYAHPVNLTPSPDHDAASLENPLTMRLHAECADCHNPHAVESAPPMISFNPRSPGAPHTTAPDVNARLGGVSGVGVDGIRKENADFQYEVCFKCHGVPGRSACDNGRCSTATSRSMSRQDGIYNLKDKVYSGTPGIVSYHPIESNDSSNNSEVPSLRTDVPLNRSTSLIYCTDCHSSDQSPAAGRLGPSGPHGSIYEGLLAQRYDMASKVSYSAAAYEVCFKCHSESTLMADASGFSHNRHLTEQGAACVNCHDPHGSHKYPHLINFLTGIDGAANIQPGTIAGLPVGPEWTDNGVYKGSCTLKCHGADHAAKGY